MSVQSKKKKKVKKAGGWKPLDVIILVIAVALLGVSSYKLAGIFLEYKAGTDSYIALEENFVQELDISETSNAAGEQEEEETEEEKELLTVGEDYFPSLAVDFAGLEGVNDDVTGWFSMPVLDIAYPVVQGDDNYYYLDHTFEKKGNSSGAIFMDANASVLMTDYNTFIYGHNMRNGSMFGKLKNFIRDEDLCRSNPYFFYYTKDKSYKYLIVSYYVTIDGSDTYYIPISDDAYLEYRRLILKKSQYQCERDFPDYAPIVTLSTCYGASGGEQRFVVHGILVETKDVD